jgi:hypothetical protein
MPEVDDFSRDLNDFGGFKPCVLGFFKAGFPAPASSLVLA